MKRLMDLGISITLLILLLPLLLLIALVIVLTLGRPVLFVQERPGKNAKAFLLYKFRSMSAATDEQGNPLPDAQRLSATGKLLRRLSLDELPQLWNIIRGDMSLVGPRPLLMEYLERYSPEQARRHEVRPGITGWAQVNGRNAISWQEKFSLDVWYVDNHNVALDLKIMCMTLLKIIRREGISEENHATARPFEGNS